MNLQGYLCERKQWIETALSERLPAAAVEPKNIHEAMRFAVLSSGKRLRPIFVLTVADLSGGKPEQLLDTACAIEFVHTASLILDDLPCMDNAQSRRGEPCTHVKFDQASALLAAMALLSKAFELVAHNAVVLGRDQRAPQAVSLLSDAICTKGLVYGQALDLAYTGKNASLTLLHDIHHLKAGVLFLASLRIPAILLDMSKEAVDALTTYANAVGLAFQITDDLLDAAHPEEDAGKSTFATHLGVNGAHQKVSSLVKEAIAAVDCFGERAVVLQALAHYVESREQ